VGAYPAAAVPADDGAREFTFSGQRVLVVEDEPLVGMLLEENLSDLGLTVVQIAVSLSEALDAAATIDADLAVLDVNLSGELSYPAAEALAKRGIPVIFVTGYARAMPPRSLSAAPFVDKPYRRDQLAAAIERALIHQPA
jgi:CheY-like chemotaxis protein